MQYLPPAKRYDLLSYDTLFIVVDWDQTQDMCVFAKHFRRQKCLIYWVIHSLHFRENRVDTHHLRKVAPPCWSMGTLKGTFLKAHFTGSVICKATAALQKSISVACFSSSSAASPVHALKASPGCWHLSAWVYWWVTPAPWDLALPRGTGCLYPLQHLAQVEYTFNLNLVSFIFVVKVTFVCNIT